MTDNAHEMPRITVEIVSEARKGLPDFLRWYPVRLLAQAAHEYRAKAALADVQADSFMVLADACEAVVEAEAADA